MLLSYMLSKEGVEEDSKHFHLYNKQSIIKKKINFINVFTLITDKGMRNMFRKC